MSRADKPVHGAGFGPSNAGWRRTEHDTRGSDSVPSARATDGFPFSPPPGPTPAARIRSWRIWRARDPDPAWIHPPAGAPAHRAAEEQEVAGVLRRQAAPAVAGTRGSSILHWIVST